MKFSGFLRVATFTVLGILCALILTFVILACQIVVYSEKPSVQSAQAAVVLGAAAWGKLPSPVYRERLNEAIRIYKQGRVSKLIFTGGTPELGYPSEAAVAREYARRNGVSDEDILVDSKSRTTYENLVQARELMKTAGINSVLLVSDPLHMMRAMFIATELDIDAQPAPSESSKYQSWTSRIKFLWRETWSFEEHLLRATTRRWPMKANIDYSDQPE